MGPRADVSELKGERHTEFIALRSGVENETIVLEVHLQEAITKAQRRRVR